MEIRVNLKEENVKSEGVTVDELFEYIEGLKTKSENDPDLKQVFEKATEVWEKCNSYVSE